jgi:hypothetical protein
MGINTFNNPQKTKTKVIEDVIGGTPSVAIFSTLSPFGTYHGEASYLTAAYASRIFILISSNSWTFFILNVSGSKFLPLITLTSKWST